MYLHGMYDNILEGSENEIRNYFSLEIEISV